MYRKVKGAILFGILITSLLAIITRVPGLRPARTAPCRPFGGFPNGIVGLPVWPADLVFQLDIGGRARARPVQRRLHVLLRRLLRRHRHADGSGPAGRATSTRRATCRGPAPTFSMDGAGGDVRRLDGHVDHHRLRRERIGHRGGRPHRPDRQHRRWAVRALDVPLAARRRCPRCRHRPGADPGRGADDGGRQARRLGRHVGGPTGLPDRDRHAADLLDRQRRQLRRDQLLRDQAAQRRGQEGAARSCTWSPCC